MAKKKGKDKKKKKKGKKKDKKEEKEEKKEEAALEEEAKGGGGSILFLFLPIVAILLFVWCLFILMDMAEPFVPQAKDDPIYTVLITAIADFVLIGIIGAAIYTHEEKDEEELKEYRKMKAHEKPVGIDEEGGEVDGEEIVEVEPEYLEVEVLPEGAEDVTFPEIDPNKFWGVVEYPPKIPGGIYSDTRLTINKNITLKMRTLIARACLLCEEQVDCWPKVRKDISKEDFKFNTECRGGLRRLGAKIATKKK
jgi:hypothetical protein